MKYRGWIRDRRVRPVRPGEQVLAVPHLLDKAGREHGKE